MRDNKIGHRAIHLKAGSRGPDVRKLENALKERKLLRGPADGRYDARTAEAVKRFERQNGLEVDGKVGNRIWNKLGLGDGFDGPQGTPAQGASRVYSGNSGVKTQPPDDTSDTGKKGTFTTITANIKSNPVMPQDKVIADVKKVARQGDLIGWQEIGPPDRYFDAIKSLGKGWDHYMPKDGKRRIPIPISWKKSEWDFKDAGYVRTHKGKEDVSPHRYISWVKLTNKKTGEEVVRMNTHLISGAWNPDKKHQAWRKDMWHEHMDQLEKMVARFEKQGHKVVVGGDFNRNHYKVLGNDVVYDNKLHIPTHRKSTLDYLMHTRDPELKHRQTKYERALNTDHDAVAVTYTLS